MGLLGAGSMKRHGLIQELHHTLQNCPGQGRSKLWPQQRFAHNLTRQRRDDFWSPTVKLKARRDEIASVTTLLSSGGFIRQNYAGIYQFLPLGLRVLEKLERLIDKHMKSLGASKVSLSSISSQAIWERSGRLDHGEMFKFNDRGDAKWLLAPTHEEEFTNMIKDFVQLPRDLPIRLYQVGRKYRDEQRPRGGLLRGREFTMKDLYTFDADPASAESTYHEVRKGYRNLFDELGVPFVEVRADSGNMGGNLSHEFHFPNAAGEDTVITCNTCDFAKNEEFVVPVKTYVNEHITMEDEEAPALETLNVAGHSYISKDSKSLVRALVRPLLSDKARTEVTRESINTHALKSALAGKVDVDTGVEEQTAQERFSYQLSLDESKESLKIWYILDRRLSVQEAQQMISHDRGTIPGADKVSACLLRSGSPSESRIDARIDLIRHRSGDPCPFCQSGELQVQQAIEIGHTFHLGTRYSSVFKLNVPSANVRNLHTQPFLEMGCHGIGVTRIIAAASACLSNGIQLQWPRAIAPYEVLIVVDPKNEDAINKAHHLYDELTEERNRRSSGRSEQRWHRMEDDRWVLCRVPSYGRLWQSLAEGSSGNKNIEEI